MAHAQHLFSQGCSLLTYWFNHPVPHLTCYRIRAPTYISWKWGELNQLLECSQKLAMEVEINVCISRGATLMSFVSQPYPSSINISLFFATSHATFTFKPLEI